MQRLFNGGEGTAREKDSGWLRGRVRRLQQMGVEGLMPSPGAIVEGLRVIANDAIALAVVWHLLLAAACIALALGWCPSQRSAGALLSVPVASVSALAFRYGNPFNGLMFAALALALLGLAGRLAPRPVQRGGAAMTVVGILMIAFAWLYPHFLDLRSPTIYVVGAPTGLIPCPTLSLLIGFTLLARGFGSRAWTLRWPSPACSTVSSAWRDSACDWTSCSAQVASACWSCLPADAPRERQCRPRVNRPRAFPAPNSTPTAHARLGHAVIDAARAPLLAQEGWSPAWHARSNTSRARSRLRAVPRPLRYMTPRSKQAVASSCSHALRK